MIWCIGDEFLRDVDHTLSTLRTSDAAQQGRKLFIHQYFNFETFYLNPFAPTKPAIARIFNSLDKALNKFSHLPEYILVLPDKDIIKSTNIYDFGVREILEANINWLIQNLARALLARQENLKKIQPGAALNNCH